jgi:hypothetical protein
MKLRISSLSVPSIVNNKMPGMTATVSVYVHQFEAFAFDDGNNNNDILFFRLYYYYYFFFLLQFLLWTKRMHVMTAKLLRPAFQQSLLSFFSFTIFVYTSRRILKMYVHHVDVRKSKVVAGK